MTEVDHIQAGTYLLVADSWEEFLSKPGEPFNFKRHKRGAILDLDVDDARRLTVAGAVIPYDVDNPTHAVQADGTVVELQPATPAHLVIEGDHLAYLSEDLELDANASVDDVVAAVRTLRDSVPAAAAQTGFVIPEADFTALRTQLGLSVDATSEDLLRAVAQTRASSPASQSGDRPASDRIQDILAWVGADPARAKTALEGERSTKGDGARPQLVEKLAPIAQTS